MRTLVAGAVFAILAFPGVASAQKVGFLVVNSTEYPIREIAISPPNINFWGPNVLAAPVLKKGEARRVQALPDGTECLQDIRATFDDDGSVAMWQHLDVCDLRRITLHFDKLTGMSTASYAE